MKRLWKASGYLVAGAGRCRVGVWRSARGTDCARDPAERSVVRSLPGSGQVPAYAQYLRSVLVDAGFVPGDVRVEAFGQGDEATATLTARYPGRDATRKSILLIGHMGCGGCAARGLGA